MAGTGHEDAFPRPRLSARCRFSQGTFAGTRASDRKGEGFRMPARRDLSVRAEGRRPKPFTEAARLGRR